MIYIGIDPGAKGGVALISDHGEEVFAWDDDLFINTMRELYTAEEKAVAVVEKVWSMSGQGVKSTFQFGKVAGFIEGVLEALGIPYQLIPPKTWKQEYSLGNDKAESIKVCKRLFPKVNLLRTEKSRKEHDGMAEALLMAEYARRNM